MKWKIKHVPNHQPIYKCSPQYVKAAPRTARLLVELIEDFLLCGWAVTSTQKHGILVIVPICSMYGIFTYICPKGKDGNFGKTSAGLMEKNLAVKRR